MGGINRLNVPAIDTFSQGGEGAAGVPRNTGGGGWHKASVLGCLHTHTQGGGGLLNILSMVLQQLPGNHQHPPANLHMACRISHLSSQITCTAQVFKLVPWEPTPFSMKRASLRIPNARGGGGGRLQPVLMQHPPPAICQNLGGGSWGGGGRLEGLGGGGGRLEGVWGGGGFGRGGGGIPNVGGPTRNPQQLHAYL